MSCKRRAVDYTGVARAGTGNVFLDALNNRGAAPLKSSNKNNISLGHRGIAGSKVLEFHPKFIKADNEVVYTDTNGSYIVLGRDRPGSRISGYGHEHGSSRIDMVVGRVSVIGHPRQGPCGETIQPLGAVNSSGENLYVDPSFEFDSARIYISAKSSIDTYFNLAPGKVGMSDVRSSVGIKADAVRIIGREGIKLVTRSDKRNSQGGLIELVKGIDLIAGNDDRGLQPLVKGANLAHTLDAIIEWVGRLNGIVDAVLLRQMAFNTALLAHTHIGATSAGMVVKVAPSISLNLAGGPIQGSLFNEELGVKIHRTHGAFLRMNSLKPWGRNYILSRYNNTN